MVVAAGGRLLNSCAGACGGGLVDGRDLVAALKTGAQGVVIGTAFLASPEFFAHDYHKQRIVHAKAEDTILTDMFHINWPIGAPVRVLQNSATRGERGDAFGSTQIIGDEEGRPIYLFSTDFHCARCRGTSRGWHFTPVRGSAGSMLLFQPANDLAAIVSEAARLM